MQVTQQDCLIILQGLMERGIMLFGHLGLHHQCIRAMQYKFYLLPVL